MPMSPTPGCADDRFSLYIEELREFLGVSGVSFGAPEDVGTFIERLSKGGSFRGEASSMVRSILYRELGKIQKPELERLVLTAVGGIDATPTVKSLSNGDELLNQLQEFIHRAFISDPIGLDSDETASGQNVDAREYKPFAEEFPFHTDELPMPRCMDMAENKVVGDFPQVDAFETKQQLTTSLYSRIRLVGSNATETSDAPKEGEARSAKVPARMRQYHWALGLFAIASLSVASGRLYDRYQLHNSPAVGNSQPVSESSISPTAVPTSSVSKSRGAVSSATGKRSYGVTNVKKADERIVVTSGTALEAGDGIPAQLAASRTAQPAGLRYTKSNSKSAPLLSGEMGSAESLRSMSERPEYPTRLQQFGGRSGLSYSSGIMSANAVSVVPPKYPRLASFAHVQGAVVMQAVIARDGTVSATRVLSGPRLLRGAATSAVRRWRYRPYVVNGQNAEVATIVTVAFRLPRH